MNLIRIIVIGLIIYLLIRAFKRWQANRPIKPANPQAEDQKNQGNMVPCKVCQLHILESDALKKNGNFYCSKAHLEQNSDQDPDQS